MADGSGGAAAAAAEAAKNILGKALGAAGEELGRDIKAAASQTTGAQFGQQSASSSQKQQQIINQQKTKEETETPQKIANVEDELKQIQMQGQGEQRPSVKTSTSAGQNSLNNSQTQNKSITDGNGKNPILAKRLFEDVQGGLAYRPHYWGEEALQRQKQEEGKKKQQEQAELEQKKQEEEKKKMEAPILPGSTQKGPVGPGMKKKANVALTQAVTKTETGRGSKG